MKHSEVILFLLVGATSAVTQIGVLAFLFEVCAFRLDWSVSIAYSASVLVHFLGNKHYTFRNTAKTGATEVLRYLGVVLLNYLITIGVVWLVVEVFKSNPYTAIVASIAATFGLGFALSKLWVFKQ